MVFELKPSPVSIPGSAIKYALACITENSSKTRDTAIAMLCLVGVCFFRAKKLGFSSGKATAKALFDTTCQTAIAGTALSILGIGLAKNPTGIFDRVIDSRKGIMWQVEASRVKVFSAQADNIIASVFIVALLSVVLTVKKTNELVGRVTYLSTTCALTRYFIYSMRYVNPKSAPNFFQSLLCYIIGEDFGSLYNYNYDS